MRPRVSGATSAASREDRGMEASGPSAVRLESKTT